MLVSDLQKNDCGVSTEQQVITQGKNIHTQDKKDKAPYLCSVINDSNHTTAKGTLRDILYITMSMKF